MTKGEDSPRYYCFTRTWWRMENGKRVPGAGKCSTRARNLSYDEALCYCRQWNETHDPGPLSRKCEFGPQ